MAEPVWRATSFSEGQEEGMSPAYELRYETGEKKIARGTRRARIPIIASAILFVAQGANAESGTYESVISIVTNYTTLEYADQTITGGPSHGKQTLIDSIGELFVKGASSALHCIVLAKKSAAGMDLEAPCTVVDSSGDKTFILYRTKGGDLTAGGAAQGTIEIVGGTGKYSGLTGKCAYQISYVPGNRGVTTQRCTWQKP